MNGYAVDSLNYQEDRKGVEYMEKHVGTYTAQGERGRHTENGEKARTKGLLDVVRSKVENFLEVFGGFTSDQTQWTVPTLWLTAVPRRLRPRMGLLAMAPAQGSSRIGRSC